MTSENKIIPLSEKMKNKKVYVIEDGYDYEGSRIVAVFDTRKKAKKHLENWKDNFRKEFNIEECSELPFGYKFGTHYRIAVEVKLNFEEKN